MRSSFMARSSWALFVVTVVLLGGCGEADTTPAEESLSSTSLSTEAPPEQVFPWTLQEQGFLSAVRARALDGDDSGGVESDEFLMEVGRAICQTLTDGGLPPDPEMGFPGRTAEQYLVENEQAGTGSENAQLVDLTVEHLCSEHKPILARAKSGKFRKASPLSSFTDGTYTVGVEINPGKYKTTTPAKDCYWERTSASGETISNDFVNFAPTGATVTIRDTDAGFVSERCGTWKRVP
jgi:hypothetical protein